MVTVRDLEWTAGFLEGEGSFASNGSAPHIQAVQVQQQPLLRLRALYGGTLFLSFRNVGKGRRRPIWSWGVCGLTGAGLMMTLYPLLSPKRREQILTALAVWRSRRARIRPICRRGHHVVDGNAAPYTRYGRRYYRCRVCVNSFRRRQRADC